MPELSAAGAPQDPQAPSGMPPERPRPEDFPAAGYIPPREEASAELALALAFAYPEGVRELSFEEADGLDDRAMGARLRESDYDVFLVRAAALVAEDEPLPAGWREWAVIDNTLGEMDEARFHTKEAALAWINMPKFSDTGRIAATADEELYAARGGLAAANARRLAKFPPMPERIECPFPLFKDRAHKKPAYRLATSGVKGKFWRLEMPAKLRLKLPAGSLYIMDDPKLAEPAGERARDFVAALAESGRIGLSAARRAQLAGMPTVGQVRAMLSGRGADPRARQRAFELMGYSPKSPEELTVAVKADDPPLPVRFFTLSVPKASMANPEEKYGYTKLILNGQRRGGAGKYTLRDPRPNASGGHFSYEVRADVLAAALVEYRESREAWSAARAADGRGAPRRKARRFADPVGTVPIDFGAPRVPEAAPAARGRASALQADVEARTLAKAGVKTKADAAREQARAKAAREKYRKEHHIAPDPVVTKVDPATLPAAARHAARGSLIPDSAKPKAAAVDRVAALRAAGSLRVSDGELARLKANPTVGRIKRIANRRGVAADVRAELLEAVDHMAAPISERTREAVLAGVASGEIAASESALRGFRPDAAPAASNLEAWTLVSPRPQTGAYRAVKAAIEEAPEPPRPKEAPAATPGRDKAPARAVDTPPRPATFREAKAPEGLGSLPRPASGN